MSCDVGHRCSLDLALLWLWLRPVATALIQTLAWEPQYAMGTALKIQEKNFKNGSGYLKPVVKLQLLKYIHKVNTLRKKMQNKYDIFEKK